MKKLVLIIMLLAFMMPVIAQQAVDRSDVHWSSMVEGMVQSTSQVGDFTITDTEGVTWNLYSMLDEGRTVFLDLFFTT